MYSIEYSKDALKSLKSMPANTRRLLISKIEELAADPFAVNNNIKKLEGRPGYRLRVVNWRIIYEIQGGSIILYVVAIGSRGGVYQ
jgi:mRNA interferase RelE/StbE